MAEAIFGGYAAAGCEVRWLASREPATALPREGERVRVSCWNGLERRLGVPYPLWGAAGAREVARLVGWADVLHVHDCLYLGSALTVLLARRARKPVLLSQHVGFVRYPFVILNGIERLAYHTLGRAVLQGASHIAFCTQAAEQFVVALLGARPKAASTIPYGIDTGRFRPPTHEERLEARRALRLPESGPVVLFVGRLVDKKGATLPPEMCRQISGFHFLMVGDGPLRPEGKDNLTWLPHVPLEQMGMVYRAADVFLLPSHSEGFPVAVLEAMASGLPVIAPKGQAFTTFLEGQEACLSAERTPEALCQALRNLAERPGLAAALASRSRALVAEEWSLKAMRSRYLTLIRNLAVGR
jgi:glycosyltransferase involved in cell wall biosynthesis